MTTTNIPNKPRQAPGRLQPSGRLVQEQRLRKGWTVDDLACRAGISPFTLYQIEAENRVARLSTINKLANALGVRPSRFMAREEAA